MGQNKNYYYAYKEGFSPQFKTPESVPCLEGHRRLGQIRDCLPIKLRIRSCTLAKKLHNSLLCLLQWVALVCAVTGHYSVLCWNKISIAYGQIQIL